VHHPRCSDIVGLPPGQTPRNVSLGIIDLSSLQNVKTDPIAPMVLEKQNGSSRPSPPIPGRRNKARPIALALMGLAGFLWLMLPDGVRHSTAKGEQNAPPSAFSWDQVRQEIYFDWLLSNSIRRLRLPNLWNTMTASTASSAPDLRCPWIIIGRTVRVARWLLQLRAYLQRSR
jgi:hypothetical protein